MKPNFSVPKTTGRSLVWAAVVWAAACCGCTSPLVRLQSPDAEPLTEIEQADEDYTLIGDVASARGMNLAKVEAVALVTGLDGTGSDPPPSSKRSMLITEMQSHDVKSPGKILASPSTSMAIAYGYLRPGIQKGERFDVAVRVPSRSQTSSLAGGFLMQGRMREMAVLDNMIHTGLPLALSRGEILVDSLFDGQTSHELRGRVLGGGVVLKDRPLGLAVRDGFNSVRTSAMIGAALNSRFHTFHRGVKQGVATPKRDNYIELKVHPRYRHNVTRYMQVIRAVPLKRDTMAEAARLETLGRKLLDPATAGRAAIELEALGSTAIEILDKGLASADPLVRFFAAESLAYLEQPQAAAPLAAAARDEIAFRWRALTALAAIDEVEAYEALTELLNVPSAETRYGAFFALRTRNSLDPFVRGEVLGNDAFSYHVIHSDADPMIHFTRSRRPEVVVFGHQVGFTPPAFLFAGKEILLKATGDGRIKISRFHSSDGDKHEICEPKLDAVIRGVASLGASYADVLAMVHQAKQEGYLEARVMINAMPKPNREYHREESAAAAAVGDQVPDLFFNQLQDDDGANDDEAGEEDVIDLEKDDKSRASKGFFGRMSTWLDS